MFRNMKVSIIIPCTRGKRVLRTVESIVKQKTKYSYEILVVGKRSGLSKFPFGVRSIESNNKLKPGKARNLGAKKAMGKYFLFLDDDCMVGEGWIDKNINILKSTEDLGAVGGKIVGYSKKYFSRCTDYTNFWRQQGNSKRIVDQLYTASLGVKKEVFVKFDGFDENLVVGEDVNFVKKLARYGYKSLFVPQIFVLHDHRRANLKDFLNYMYDNGFKTGLNVLETNRGIIYKILLCFFRKAYFLFVFPTALIYTISNLYINLLSNRGMLLYLPFIFMGYLVYHFGIAVKLLKEA